MKTASRSEVAFASFKLSHGRPDTTSTSTDMSRSEDAFASFKLSHGRLARQIS